MALRAIDWSEIFEDFRRLNLDDGGVVRALHGNISLSAVRMYRDGINQPTHLRGELILELWCRMMSKSRDDAPMCDAHDRLRDDRSVSGKRRGQSAESNAYADLDAVFRPGLATVMDRISAQSSAKHRQGDCVTLPLPGFEI